MSNSFSKKSRGDFHPPCETLIITLFEHKFCLKAKVRRTLYSYFEAFKFWNFYVNIKNTGN